LWFELWFHLLHLLKVILLITNYFLFFVFIFYFILFFTEIEKKWNQERIRLIKKFRRITDSPSTRCHWKCNWIICHLFNYYSCHICFIVSLFFFYFGLVSKKRKEKEKKRITSRISSCRNISKIIWWIWWTLSE